MPHKTKYWCSPEPHSTYFFTTKANRSSKDAHRPTTFFSIPRDGTEKQKCPSSLSWSAAGPRKALQVLAAVGGLLVGTAVNIVAVEQVFREETRGAQHQLTEPRARQLKAAWDVQKLETGKEVVVGQVPVFQMGRRSPKSAASFAMPEIQKMYWRGREGQEHNRNIK